MDLCGQSNVSAFQYAIGWLSLSFQEVSFNFMAAVILEPRKIKSGTISTVSPSICHEVMGPDANIF